MGIKLSVIVPVYNGEKYLERCIKSILKQTIENLELILVNDGSTDRTKNICNEYLKIDSRIKVIHQENSGVSLARNKGIETACGQYVGFVDSDDWIDTNMYDELIKNIEEAKADIAIAGLTKEYKSGKKKNACFSGKKILTSEDALKTMIKQELFSWEMCDKLYKKELFEKIRLSENLTHGEDLFANYLLFKASNLCVVDNQGWYHYFQHEDSVCNAQFSLKALSFLESIKLLHQKVKKEFLIIEPLVNYVYVRTLIGISLEFIYSGLINKEKVKFIGLRKEIRSELHSYLTCEFTNVKEIILGSFFYLPVSIQIILGKCVLYPLCLMKRRF